MIRDVRFVYIFHLDRVRDFDYFRDVAAAFLNLKRYSLGLSWALAS